MTIDVNDWYRGVLGRDADAPGLADWNAVIAGGMSEADAFNWFKSSATGNGETVNNNFGMDSVYEAPKGVTSGGDSSTLTDEWAANNGVNLSPSQAAQLKADYIIAAGQGGQASTDLYAKFLADNNVSNGLDYGTASRFGVAPPPQFQQNNPGIEAPVLADYKKNPYLDQMAAGITSQMDDNWTRNIAPSLRSGAMATGGFGGSRQGVVEANGANDMNRSLSQNLTNLYGTDYTNSQNRNLQKYGMDQSYNLGMANNNLGYANLDSNNAQFGANLGLNTMNAQTAWANNGVSAANGINQQPINYFNTFANNTNTSGGLGGTGTSTTGSTTNGLSTGLGMGMAVDLLGNYIKTPAMPGGYPG